MLRTEAILKLLGAITADPDSPPRALTVAFILTKHINGATGEAVIRVNEIAAMTGLSERTARRALSWLRAAGYIGSRKRGQGAAYAYWIAAPKDGRSESPRGREDHAKR